MTPKDISIKQALNKAYRLIKPKRPEMELFKKNLITLLGQIDERESEENVKIHLMHFLRITCYDPAHLLATKGKTDFVVHSGKDAATPAGVLFEVKRPLNTADMVSKTSLNAKAMHELVLYYLRERIEQKNNSITNLVITNIYEWYVFDASIFERIFYKNTGLVKQYKEWAAGQKVSTSTDLFYKEIAKPFLAALEEEIPFTWFDIRAFEKPLKNADKEDDKILIPLFKVLSPVHLLKLPFANDSNTLDKGFYAELLHLIGLEEVKDGSKKIIRRKKAGERNEGSLLENAITILETENCLHKVPDINNYGAEKQDQLFSVGLELCITWINRILFLKLLEAQLLKYHKNNSAYRFLNFTNLPQYDEVYKLFFQVLAKRYSERSEKVQKKFSHVPYLNSSLFEFSEMEDATIKINMLDDTAELNLIASTVLRNDKNKPKADKLNTLQYLFEFLDAYDFASEGEENIQEEGKTLINASVLGLIFEKINGYKDGSIFTPGFITMYMCRQSIRQAILNKFTEAYNWKAESFADLRNYISEDRSTATVKQYSQLVNSLTICDPAVGSGHFLVSALNEMIAVKAELGILINDQGLRLTDVDITLENDELLVYENGDPFTYPVQTEANGLLHTPPKKQDIQKTLFHEKQTIIENCLFGVDINPKSVQICRLRLWIELLKNAYYIIPEGQPQNSGRIGNELQTLPNIDINIKCGNSLISRFPLQAKFVTKGLERKINDYKKFVAEYKNTKSGDYKRGLRKILFDLRKELAKQLADDTTPLRKELDKLAKELYEKYESKKLFGNDLTEKQIKHRSDLENQINSIAGKIDKIFNNPIYENAFEWRFEFPEVLDEEGNYYGFDLIISNPPYGSLIPEEQKEYFKGHFNSVQGPFEIYKFFMERSFDFLHEGGLLSFISPDTWTNLSYFKNIRQILYDNYKFLSCTETIYNVFDEATVDTNIYLLEKKKSDDKNFTIVNNFLDVAGSGFMEQTEDDYVLNLKAKTPLIEKIERGCERLGKLVEVWRGMSAYGAKNPLKPYNSSTKDSEFHRPLLNGGDIGKYKINWAGEYIKYGEWLHRPRPSFIYDRPHLLIQRIRNPRLKERIIATFDSEKYISSDGLSNIILNDDNQNSDYLKYLLAVLNSKLINYWFSFSFFDVNIKPEQLRKIPVKNASKELFSKILTEVNKALIAENEKTLNQSITAIDKLVFKLYDLTPEEIKIIDEAL
jgi:tRNA1(Val) A37 N6-methylase TrmN6